jgi:hypothetical protein
MLIRGRGLCFLNSICRLLRCTNIAFHSGVSSDIMRAYRWWGACWHLAVWLQWICFSLYPFIPFFSLVKYKSFISFVFLYNLVLIFFITIYCCYYFAFIFCRLIFFNFAPRHLISFIFFSNLIPIFLIAIYFIYFILFLI